MWSKRPFATTSEEFVFVSSIIATSVEIFFQSLKVSFDFFLSRLHKCQQLRPSLCYFTVNFIRIFWGRWSIATIEAIFSEGFVIPRMMPSSLSALQHHIHSTQDADTFSTLFGCVQFSVLSHDKRIGLTKFNYFESISSRCRLSNVSGDNCVGVALSPPRSPQKWKNVRGEAKLGCGGATAPHAYFKPCPVSNPNSSLPYKQILSLSHSFQ